MNQAVESLAIELASSNIVEHEVQLTEDQKALAIPPPLVYVAGLVLICSNKSTSIDLPFPVELQERFLKLQKLYYNGVKSDDAVEGNENNHQQRTFHLSPRLLPSSDQLVLIQKDVAAKLGMLENQAESVAKELTADQDEIDKKNQLRLHNINRFRSSKKKSVNPKSNVNQSQKAPAIQERHQEQQQEGKQQEEQQHPHAQSDREETLQDLMNMQIRTEDLQDAGEDSTSWMTIAKRGNKLDSDSRKDVTEGDNTLPWHSNNRNPYVAPLRDFNNSESDELSDAILLPTSIPSIPGTGTHTHSSNDAPPSYSDRAMLQERNRRLEMKIVGKNEQLLVERKTNSKSMRLMKEDFENQIQALQMRLYISETRLKNYQDALEQHVQTVADNFSGT
jgi:hypothetical protein